MAYAQTHIARQLHAGNGLAGLFSALVRRVADAAARRRARNELCALTEHELADIGISRGDIDAVVDGTFRR